MTWKPKPPNWQPWRPKRFPKRWLTDKRAQFLVRLMNVFVVLLPLAAAFLIIDHLRAQPFIVDIKFWWFLILIVAVFLVTVYLLSLLSGVIWEQLLLSRLPYLGAMAAIAAVVFTSWTFQRSADFQANIAASSAIREHYQLAASHSVTPVESASRASGSGRELASADGLVLQHGLQTAEFVFDISEDSREHAKWKATAGSLLERYQGRIGKADFPCETFDDEFVRFAESELEVDWCQCQSNTCESQ